ncbi:hypothetical protein [Vibrio splendidus]|uniref:hypothetical protein n=1 Tax=Vibrio splendidus TaxID=29497 RepID=UPI00352C2D15
MKKLNVIISKKSEHALSDWDVLGWYENILNCEETTVFVATSIMLNELRVGVRLGEIEPFSFEFEGHTVKCLDDGRLDNWPNGLGDHLVIQMESLLKRISRKEARNNFYKVPQV